MDENNHNLKSDPVRPENSERRAKIIYSKLKRRVLKHVLLLRIFIVLIAFGIFGGLIFASLKFSENIGVGNYFALLYDFATAPVGQIASDQGRVNILVMGKAGGDRPGDNPNLTDTMILISIGLEKPNIAIISIPRDIWIPEIRGKVNSAYYWGSQNTPYFKSAGGAHPGITFAKSIVSEVVGRPIQYGAVIDFSAFKEVVDALGGVQVDVANSFTDNLYPVAGREDDMCGGDPTLACRYMTVSFKGGLQNMDGSTALEFVRSRHAEGVEGGDQAREARQQKVIDAIKNKLMQSSVYLSPKTDLALFNIAQKYIETDIDGTTAAILARVILRDYKNINQYLIPNDLLATPPVSAKYDLQQVFVPVMGSGKWDDINKWFTSVL